MAERLYPGVREHADGLSAQTPDAMSLLVMRMVEWKGAVEALTAPQRQELSKELDAMMIASARLRGYVEAVDNYEHGERVRRSNRLAAAVRKALGYMQPKHDVSF